MLMASALGLVGAGALIFNSKTGSKGDDKDKIAEKFTEKKGNKSFV